MEAGVVARLQKMHEFVRHHELQALGRISGQSGVDADRTGFRRARTPTRLHGADAPARCMDADAGLHALDHIGQRAQHFGAVELVEGGLICGGLTGGGLPGGGLSRDRLTRDAPVDGGLTGDRLPAGALPAGALTVDRLTASTLTRGTLTGVCLNGVERDELAPERYAIGQFADEVQRWPALDVAVDALGDLVAPAFKELVCAGER